MPYHAILHRPLNYNESSDIAYKLKEADKVLKASADYLATAFDAYKASHDVKAKQSYFPVGCKLFVKTSQRGRLSFKLAPNWSGPFICIKQLDNNNLLIRKIGGRKEEKVHKNLCKRVSFREDLLRLQDISFPYRPNDRLSPSLTDSDPFSDISEEDTPPHPPAQDENLDENLDNEIESDDSEADHATPENSPPASPPVPRAPNNSPTPPVPAPRELARQVEEDRPREPEAPPRPAPPPPPAPREQVRPPDHPPRRAPPVPPKTRPGKPGPMTGAIPKTTRSSTKAAGITLPTPSYQKETIEATLRKARKAEAEKPSSSGGSSTSSTRTKVTSATQAAYKAEEARHLANLAKIKQRTTKK